MRFQYVSTIFLATAVTFANAQGLGGAISSAISGAASVGGDITSGAVSVGGDITSGGAGVLTTIVSGGSSIVTNASAGAESGASNASSQLSTSSSSGSTSASSSNAAVGNLVHFDGNGNLYNMAGLTVAALAGAGAIFL